MLLQYITTQKTDIQVYKSILLVGGVQTPPPVLRISNLKAICIL